jgi:hypothetical protein
MIVTGSSASLRKNPDRGGIAADIGQKQGNAQFRRVLANTHS